ncbi:MAG: hypothetical protein E7582_02685 [Ruminococcaceae bacterium]|nr:hypothetical protein [Oscillospiraceae bacterium]
MFKKIKHVLYEIVQFILNPRFLFCFGVAWIVTNGWAYILFGISTYFGISWMFAISSAYLAFLWLPVSPEKLVTFAIAIAILKKLFPQDTKTLGKLKKLHNKVRSKIKNKSTKNTNAEKEKI